MPFLSLIIPVYNTEKYLRDCLNSCINQTFKDIEIICVNDCSPDNSQKILDEYAEKDNRITVINHYKNRGLGGARNSGLDIAKGKYIWFIDSDDMIPLDACEILFSIITKNNIDIIRFNIYNFDHNDKIRIGFFNSIHESGWPYNILFSKNDFSFLPEATEVTACTYISSSLIMQKYRFRENVYHEDCDFTPILFSESNSIYCVNNALYFRRIHKESITGGGIALQETFKNKLKAIESLFSYVKENKIKDDHFCSRILNRLISFYINDYKDHPEVHNDELNKIYIYSCRIKNKYYGDINIYNDIVSNYGYSRILNFILKTYRFIVKRIKKKNKDKI